MTFKITPEAKTLFDALIQTGIFAELEYWDGHKHIDIFIPAAKLYIEVDGLPHLLNPKQIASDFLRDHYSDDDGFNTLRLPNMVVKENLDGVVKAIIQIVEQQHDTV
jgi:very-short-patch-repair endonuclease